MTAFIDSHVHFWDLDRNYYPWLSDGQQLGALRYGDYEAIRKNYLPGDFIAEAGAHEVQGFVHVDALWDPADPVGETRWLAGLRETLAQPMVAVVHAALGSDAAPELLAAHAQYPFVRGVRHLPKPARCAEEVVMGSPGTVSDPRWQVHIELLERHGYSLDLQTRVWHYAEVARLARDFPRTTIVLNHTGMLVDREPATLAQWRQALECVAAESNVVMKISGLGLAGRRWQLEDNREVILKAIEIFGADRCLFGSNFPVDKLVSSLTELVDGVGHAIDGLSDDTRRKLFADNARRIYRMG